MSTRENGLQIHIVWGMVCISVQHYALWSDTCTGRHIVPERLQLLLGWRAQRAYKEGDIKFLEFCGVARRASRDGGLLQLLGRERVVIPLESLARALGRGVGLEEILKTHLSSTFKFCFNND
jgi:hypothetical protein